MSPPTAEPPMVVGAAPRGGTSGEAWFDAARCRVERADFFPHDTVGVALARRICGRCPVRSACLEFALEHHIRHGVWGGTSERARDRMARARRASSAGERRPARGL